MNPGDHDNYECSCLPHDMEIQLAVSFIKFLFKAMNKAFNFPIRMGFTVITT